MLILYNTHIYTPERKDPSFSDLAIQGERILAIGKDAEIIGRYGSQATLVNLEGKTIWPGLIDAHLHL